MTASENGDRDPAAKICIHCHRDCASRPRRRDPQGKYHCGECLEKLRAGRSTKAPDATEQDAAIIPLELEPAAEPARSESGPGRSCPACGAPMGAEGIICLSCGFNTATGRTATGRKPKPPRRRSGSKMEDAKCSNCGYSLQGLKTPLCPECGTMNRLVDSKRRRDREDSRAVTRNAYLVPLCMFLGGAAAVSLLLALTQDEPVQAVLTYFISFAIEVPIGMLVYWICGVVWLGFDAPLHLIALRLIGIYAVTDVVQSLVGMITLQVLAYLMACALYVHLLAEMLDMELSDAIYVGLFTFLAKLVLWLVLWNYFFSP